LGFCLLFFPGGTHPQPQFSFLANRITPFPISASSLFPPRAK
jgi:hypothetical protein